MATLSIKNVPDELLDRLRKQAKSHHRSLQGELMAILESGTQARRMSISEVHDVVKGFGLRKSDDSTRWIRETRDGR